MSARDERRLLSVVIPVKDDARELEACLAALAVQTLRVDEVVVVDNASSDDSAAVAARSGARVVRCGEPGIPAAAACGYDAAHGDVILRLDADSRPDGMWVETMLAALDDPTVAAVSAGAVFVDGPRPLRRVLAGAYLGTYLLLATLALGHPPVFGSNLAMRRDAWRDVRGRVHRDREVHDDLDLAFHLGEQHRIRWIRARGMGMSMRPFDPRRGVGRRVVRGVRTVVRHWPHEFPPFRAARRIVVALEAASGHAPSPARGRAVRRRA